MHTILSRMWQPQKHLRFIPLAALILSCLVALIVAPQILSVHAAQDGVQLISQNRPAVASSTELVLFPPQAAVDGDTKKTRWSSAYSDPQWLAVDLGKNASISRVDLNWETAYAKAYTLQVSDDGINWKTIYTQKNGKGGTEKVQVSGEGRYIRMYGTQRATQYGYSLWEFKVYGQPGDTTTSTAPSGESMPVGDLTGWHQVFTEDFNTNVALGDFPGTAYDKKFTIYPDTWPDTAGQLGSPSKYYPSKVLSVKNGLLNLYLHTENGTPMGAAILPILENHQYGKYTIRFKSDSLKGFKTAWLLWPDSQNGGIAAKDGEIDFPEGPLDGTINGFMHPRDGSEQDAFDSGVTYTSWHTASLEWSPGKVRFILDDKVVGTSTRAIPNVPMQWVIQTESCLDGCPSPSTAGNLQIDWVVAYDPA